MIGAVNRHVVADCQRNFNNSFVISWFVLNDNCWSGCPWISIPVVMSHHCRNLGKGRVVVIVSTGESRQTLWKWSPQLLATPQVHNVRVVTTHDSRLFLNECFISSRRVVFKKTLADV